MPRRSASFSSATHDLQLLPSTAARLAYLEAGQKGYRVSAAFFGSLQANLRLVEGSASPLASPSLESANRQGFSSFTHKQNAKSDSALICPSPLDLSHEALPKKPTSAAHPVILPPSRHTPHKSKARSRSNSLTKSNPPADHGRPAVRPHLYWTTSRRDITSGLSLIASTVVEQRRLAFRALLIHPLNLFFYMLLLYVLRKSIVCISYVLAVKAKKTLDRPGAQSEPWPVVCLAWACLSLITLAAAYFVTCPYAQVAREITAEPPDKEQKNVKSPTVSRGIVYAGAPGDELLVAVMPDPSQASNSPEMHLDDRVTVAAAEQDVVVGSLVLNWVPGAPTTKSKRRRSSGGKAYVKAWAVANEWRGCGVGVAMLEEAVRVTLRERGGDAVLFSDTHAHSQRVLPSFYNGLFDRRDRRAQLALANALDARSCSYNRRR